MLDLKPHTYYVCINIKVRMFTYSNNNLYSLHENVHLNIDKADKTE